MDNHARESAILVTDQVTHRIYIAYGAALQLHSGYAHSSQTCVFDVFSCRIKCQLVKTTMSGSFDRYVTYMTFYGPVKRYDPWIVSLAMVHRIYPIKLHLSNKFNSSDTEAAFFDLKY